jgi:hypothetical protein
LIVRRLLRTRAGQLQAFSVVLDDRGRLQRQRSR